MQNFETLIPFKFLEYEYLFINESVVWWAAENKCYSWGGNLASIRTLQENNFVLSLHKDYDAWIGYNDNEIEGSFAWAEDPMSLYNSSFVDWANGQPDNDIVSGTGQDCVYQDTYGKWIDNQCYMELPYVCKRYKRTKVGSIFQELWCDNAGGICKYETNCGGNNRTEHVKAGLCKKQPKDVKCCIPGNSTLQW
uniref:C-type lectin domain-containing protein n=1 Tax=Plectus sambesii TaxID=2011161 RepID=A0A914XI61_9BILA